MCSFFNNPHNFGKHFVDFEVFFFFTPLHSGLQRVTVLDLYAHPTAGSLARFIAGESGGSGVRRCKLDPRFESTTRLSNF